MATCTLNCIGKDRVVSPTRGPTEESDDSEDVETTEANTKSKPRQIISTYTIGANPMWYVVIASAGLIICGSIICCCGIFFYYKKTRAVLVEQKQFEQAELNKMSGSAPGGEIKSNEATYKDADAEPDGYVLTVPPHLQPGTSIFNMEAEKVVDVGPHETNDIDNINNDIVIHTSGGIDIHESDSTPLPETDSDEESSSSVDKDAITPMQPPHPSPYSHVQAMCGVVPPGMMYHNAMAQQMPQGLMYHNGQYVPYVTIPPGSPVSPSMVSPGMVPHVVAPGVVVSPSLPPPPPPPSQ
eukprot:183278_1